MEQRAEAPPLSVWHNASISTSQVPKSISSSQKKAAEKKDLTEVVEEKKGRGSGGEESHPGRREEEGAGRYRDRFQSGFLRATPLERRRKPLTKVLGAQGFGWDPFHAIVRSRDLSVYVSCWE